MTNRIAEVHCGAGRQAGKPVVRPAGFVFPASRSQTQTTPTATKNAEVPTFVANPLPNKTPATHSPSHKAKTPPTTNAAHTFSTNNDPVTNCTTAADANNPAATAARSTV